MGLKENITQYIANQYSWYHTPGHGGQLQGVLSSIAPYDVTELPLTGSLYDGSTLFLDIEKQYEKVYGGGSVISGGGCTLAIQTMLTLYCKPGDQVLFSRTAHRSGVSTAGLLDLQVHWLYPDQYRGEGLAGTISVEGLKQALEDCPQCKVVYVTSPDYFGCTVDLKAFAQVCKEKNIPLLVDNAHGSHLVYFNRHPLQLGATASADSLHKTLPVMTGGAMLQLRDVSLKERARRLMPLYGSTSPSYPILLSIEQCGHDLEALQSLYEKTGEEVAKLKAYAKAKGLLACDSDDPLRIVLRQGGGDIGSLLAELAISPELVEGEHLIFLCSPFVSLTPLYTLCDRLVPEENIVGQGVLPKGIWRMNIRQALFSPHEELPVEKTLGRIAGEVVALCPPGIPICIPGEEITENIIILLKKYSIRQIIVL